jgi:hypothetical protein
LAVREGVSGRDGDGDRLGLELTTGGDAVADGDVTGEADALVGMAVALGLETAASVPEGDAEGSSKPPFTIRNPTERTSAPASSSVAAPVARPIVFIGIGRAMGPRRPTVVPRR